MASLPRVLRSLLRTALRPAPPRPAPPRPAAPRRQAPSGGGVRDLPGGLAGVDLAWDARAAVTVVLASRGYPETASKGDVIRGLDAVPPGAEVTHAGTAERDGTVVTAGGRVLNVTALGADIAAARAAAYAAASVIAFEGMQIRRDIAERAA